MRIYRRYPDQEGFTDIRPLDDESLIEQRPPSIDLSKPTLFYFPGFQTVDNGTIYNSNAQESLNLKSSVIESHVAKAAEKYKSGQFNFVTLTYSPERLLSERMRKKMGLPDATSRSGRLFDAATFMWRPKKYYRQDAQDFTDRMIMPAILNEDGSLKSKKEISRVFNNLTFVGDSYGSTFAHQVGNYLKYRLSRHKDNPGRLSKDDADDVIKDIVFIGASNIVMTNKNNRFRGVYFEGNNDKFIEMARKLRNIKELVIDNWRRGRSMPEMIEGPDNDDYQQIRHIQDNGAYITRNAEGFDINSIHKDYTPTPEKSDVRLERVDKGIVVRFNVPEKYLVLLKDKNHGHILRYYENPERHQSYSYFYPVSAQRDHADLFGRILRNAVSFDPRNKHRGINFLLKPELPLIGVATFDGGEVTKTTQMNRHLNAIIANSLPEYGIEASRGFN